MCEESNKYKTLIIMKTLFSRLLLAAPAVSSFFLLACAKDNDPAPASKESPHAAFTSRYSGLKDSGRKYFPGFGTADREFGYGLGEFDARGVGVGAGEAVYTPHRFYKKEEASMLSSKLIRDDRR